VSPGAEKVDSVGTAARRERASIDVLTFEQIKELIEQVAERRLQGLEIERSGFRLKIDGQLAAPRDATSSPPASSAPESPPASSGQGSGSARPGAPAPSVAAALPTSPEQQEEGPPAGTHVLKSPIVGTFYRRPSPDADPFVHIGDRVREGQVLCIVEAMKLMNEIESDVDGEIVEIYPENAQAVEYGESLFAIKPE
jgi:acetyl-CoA carboxylase biotin carboxyl carrier protein